MGEEPEPSLKEKGVGYPALLLLGTYPEKVKAGVQTTSLCSMFTVA